MAVKRSNREKELSETLMAQDRIIAQLKELRAKETKRYESAIAALTERVQLLEEEKERKEMIEASTVYVRRRAKGIKA